MGGFVIFFIGLTLGIAFGFGVYHLFFKLTPEERGLARDLKKLRKDFREYEFEVSDHIKQSAALILDIENTFDKLNSHILEGADTLNKRSNKQSILQPDTHYLRYHDADSEVSELHQDTAGNPIFHHKDHL